ncbi:chromosome segregation protein SMC [Candidatus Pacearchaeota archaeon]|nr:MAG: chromosome segregation protein SMC [Candidatus Pacearchaeota archaeon]
MAYIKKLVMQGFKSFARRTEIPFENSMNVIVGPNGSGKSNITDALCFVLGRLSIKSIRAAKAANLIFSGNKTYKAAQEAFVELVFDNSDNSFNLNSKEVVIRRIVRKNGNSVYKINGETKTRQELIELLSSAGIDPNGFNIILQGEIQSLVKSSPEERRKIIEEVAGISIYETRKQKSLRELEKTEERLKEVNTILRERNSYLKNLEKERADALNFQRLERKIKRCKAGILLNSVKEKERDISEIEDKISKQSEEIEKTKREISKSKGEISELQKQIDEIEKTIESATSNEQEVLHREISDLKAELAGLLVRKENFESRIFAGEKRLKDYEDKISEMENELLKIKTKNPKLKQEKEKQKKLQKQLDEFEKKRRLFYHLRSEIATAENKREEKLNLLREVKKEIGFLSGKIESTRADLKFSEKIDEIRKMRGSSLQVLGETKNKLKKLEEENSKIERENAVLEENIKNEEKLKNEVLSFETCPVCRQKVCEEHKNKIFNEAEKKVAEARKKISKNSKKRLENLGEIEKLQGKQKELTDKINELNLDEIRIKSIYENEERKERLNIQKKLQEEEIEKISKNLNSLKEKIEDLRGIEEKYDEIRVRLQEINFPEIDVESEYSLKQKEINRLSIEQKAVARDIENCKIELRKINSKISEKEELMKQKEEQERKLYEKFQKLFSKKSELQDMQKAKETDVIGFEHMVKNFEDHIGHLKIQKAQIKAQQSAIEDKLKDLDEESPLKLPSEKLREELQKAQFQLSRIGSVNMKALEMYEKVEEQCRTIKEKVDSIQREKEEILEIIKEIDRKKKRAFLKTLEAINKNFTRNFAHLSKKGTAFLELENKKDPFSGGLNILIKVSRGKYFDVASLSGGEKTLIALSLIFSIQEYSPYCFYIFDEIDAALDKRNSELLAALIKRYLLSGQYIVITHNDALISEAKNLYGVSMQDNISKIVSLKV